MMSRERRKWWRRCWLVRMRRLYLPMLSDGRIAGEDIPIDTNVVLVGNRVMVKRDDAGEDFGFTIWACRAGERYITLGDIWPSPLRSAEQYHYEHAWGD